MKDLLKSENFNKVRVMCNKRAKELNMLREVKIANTKKRKWKELEDEGVTAPKLVFSQRDVVAGMDEGLTNYAEI